MTRIVSIALVATLGLVLAAPAPVSAQQAEKVWRVGFLTPGKVSDGRMAAFREGMKALGYVEGKNLVIEERGAEGRRDRLGPLAAELSAAKIDIFLAHGDATKAAARAADDSGRAIPVVFAVAADPVGSGFVNSLAKPGGHVTGLSDSHSILVPKRLELLKEAVPSIRRVAVFWSPKSPFTRHQLAILKGIAPRLGITLIPIAFGSKADVEPAFAALKAAKADALNVLGYPFIGVHRRRIVRFIQANRLPAIFTARRWVAAGALMSYGISFRDQYRRAAVLVDKILKGAKPAELPVEQPTRFYLRLNLKTAKEMGIKIPPSVLLRADEVIE